MVEAKIPKGYKQTEVGVIPEEWEVKPLFSLSTQIGETAFTPPRTMLILPSCDFVNGNNLCERSISIADITMCVSESEYGTSRKNLS